ncbi:Rossman fold protein, TIGR00730 family [Candidatus Kaiserbacteria bacterium RIFCSPHIGHO2_01_FULL_55_17]|uniref:Cytokinin riboside 5'-monophosphate phosphoribohydrolase n=1 Tax=Candidatus Kaiserbacteria bacterium RIFCSPHIGHO2_01_FULL_55_17 TaxID=1798484 RepID=A0A1F6DAG5_9BACT|nr:MAG: Rossman fold protein, TIGR00730 family [Candidatus Kaiserbacteria bacterium RIFCSPHIGHO2_01_FULL_55_17]
MNICVFCSANDIAEKYSKPSAEFARLLARGKHTLIWGGSDKGVMKIIASAAQEEGGKIIGISMKILEHHARKGADEMIVAKDLSERKNIMLERADGFVALPGGIGTLDEITHILELKKHAVHKKPVVLLNIDNFYQGFKEQLQRMKNDAFLSEAVEGYLHFAATPQEAIEYLER